MSIKNFKDGSGRWMTQLKIDQKTYFTKSGLVWRNMLARTRTGSAAQIDHPSYIGCSISKNFKDFQFFTEWHINQIGFDQENYHIDKDILFEGNKLYSENTCVLIPAELNTFFNSHKMGRGLYPQGVSYHSQSNKYLARINISGRNKNLGSFKTPEEAFEIYKIAKELEVKRWVERLQAKEFVVDQRVIERLKLWELIC